MEKTSIEPSLTQLKLKELFNYDPETGIFTRLKSNKKSLCHDDRGYIKVKVGRKMYYAHRLAYLYMIGRFPISQIDHINHTRDDNSWDNLRDATIMENQRNRSMNKDNTSGFTGVSYHKRIGKWCALIKINGRQKHLGIFAKLSDAIQARKLANIKYGFHENHGSSK